MASSALELQGISTALIPGGSFTVQGVYRHGKGLSTTNALRIYLGQ
ncbi:hypothetical protein Poly30_02780 [Planctomycetes bacterium Poly30]|uniref:Uncharacterized protein n=1 Tax=Saltatorellus ferox TaxID=2528018 RepID=A0A518EL14_9BACT|nr:hypothetical protein Poly30_02780 [Planctomycetes bacterium Poly30]